MKINWTGADLNQFYKTLYKAYGFQNWWPSNSPFETVIGAILAQNVSWKGAHQAVQNLIDAGLMTPESLVQAGINRIAPLITSSRYYNQKAQKICTFLDFFFTTCAGDMSNLAALSSEQIREELLQLKGFGPETVDSILLYALDKPIFVVDAYTRRIGSRQGWFDPVVSYQEMQDFFMDRLSPDIVKYNDFHAQIVFLGNKICKKNPDCLNCPVREVPGFFTCIFSQKDE